MNAMQTNQNRVQVVAGSLTAHWLLWGLPARLGVAADRGIREDPIVRHGNAGTFPDVPAPTRAPQQAAA